MIAPALARTDNRAVTAKTRSDSGPPEEWFDGELLAAHRLGATSFDFFVDWRTWRLSRPVLAKLSATRTEGEGVVGADVSAVRSALAGHTDRGQVLFRMASNHDLDPVWVVVPDWCNWGASSGEILWCPVGSDGLPQSVKRMGVQAIREMIAEHTGERFKPQKGLYWSTTGLEGYLSGTDTPWPGDADLVLVAHETGLPTAIVEFRKQTQDRELTSRFLDYYPGPDSRRWDRLAVLARHFDPPPVLLAVHYSVVESEMGVLVVRMGGDPGSLVEVSEDRFQVPTNRSEQAAFTEAILRMI